MSNLSKERIQQIWDYELISAWDEKGRVKMWKVIHKFLNRVHPNGPTELGDVGFEDAIDYLVHLELKRCLDIDHRLGIHTFQSFKQDVIGFILARCERLSNDLINNVPKPLILLDIANYKFKKLDITSNSKNTYEKRKEQNKTNAHVKVKARSLSGNWNTVK